MTKPDPHDEPRLTSTVLTAVLRVAGPVVTDVRPHAIGTPQRQVTARIGDVLIYLTDPRAAARIRQRWDAAQHLAAQRLPERVSQTWLAPDPDAYPLGITVRLDGPVGVTPNGWPAAAPWASLPTRGPGSGVSYGRSATSRHGGRSATPGSTSSATSSSEMAQIGRAHV